jgi:hypothetical protein
MAWSITIYFAGHRVIISKSSANSSISLSAKGRVITFDNNWSVIVKKN